MFQLHRFYDLLKKEFSGLNYLKSCEELYNKSQYKEQISNHLREMGFTCSKDMESTLFFALVDIIVVVDSDNDFYFATFNESKIVELKNLGRILPRKDDLDYSKASSIIKTNTFTIINEYLSKGKFHFIKLNVLDLDSFYCNIGTMNPYPSLSSERVFSIDFISKVYWGMCNLLVRGYYKVGDIACSISPLSTNGKQLNNYPLSCKLNVKTTDGILEEIYLWNIDNIEVYADYKFLKDLLTGVCKVGDSYLTLNRDILEKYYGYEYLCFESQGVRERYCLEELFDRSNIADIRYYVNKYRLYKDKEVCSCSSIYELKSLLRSRLKSTKNNNVINARVLVSPNQIWGKYKSYYKSVKVNSEYSLVTDIDSILPKIYKLGAVSSLGYCKVEVKAVSKDSAKTIGKSEFIRQYGSIFKDEILGLECGNEVIKGFDKVFDISVDTQHKIAEIMSWGYVEHYNSYSTLIRGIIDTLDISLEVTDDMIKLLLVNNIAKEVGKCGNVKPDVVGYHLAKFLGILTSNTNESIENILNSEREKLSKRGVKK